MKMRCTAKRKEEKKEKRNDGADQLPVYYVHVGLHVHVVEERDYWLTCTYMYMYIRCIQVNS